MKRSIPVTAVRENVPVMTLAGIAFGASFGHIVKLTGEHGPHGWVQYATAGVVDLLCIIGAEERQRDKRISRPRTGKWVSWPTIVLITGIALTLAANMATAEKGLLGYFVAALPAGALLLAVSVLERRASFAAAAGTGTARRQSRPAGTAPAPPIPAPVKVPVPADPAREVAASTAEPAERTFGILLAEARAYRAELAATTGERVTKDRLRLRLGVGSSKALDVLKVLNKEGASETVGEAEAVGR